jgi:hypothetical protein
MVFETWKVLALPWKKALNGTVEVETERVIEVVV